MPRSPLPPLALLTTVLVAACGASSGPSGSSASPGEASYATDGTLTIAFNYAPGSWDPYPATGAGITALNYLIYDSLVNQRSNGEFVTGLAEQWSVDPSSATFTLRDDVTCSDGSPLTASQVADAIAYVSDPANQSAMYGFHTPTVPVTATGDDAAGTVEVTTEEPYGFLLETIGRLPIVCANGMRDRELLTAGSDGTGPFVLTEVVPGQSATFTRRDDYAWGPEGATTAEPGVPKTVVVRFIESATTTANLLLAGELNLAQITGPDVDRLDAAPLERVDWETSGSWLSFNHSAERILADRRVREALVSAVDLAEVIKVSTGGHGSASTGLLPFDFSVCAADTADGLLPEHDVAAAEALLDEAGWVRGADGTRAKDGRPLAIDLVYFTVTSEYQRPTAEYLAQQWEAIGVQVELPGYSSTAATEVLYQTSNWDVYLSGWEFILPSQMVPYLSGPVPPDGLNIMHLDNPEYERLAAEAITMTPPEACASWNEAERAVIGELDLVPVSNASEPWFLRGAEAEIQYRGPVATSLRVLEQ
ncbi:ABC transporter substrate-binding protein [Jiangella anatolica]|uniref:Peptide ABC transporter substrate-binding protein n=1 Tax=Jiangella anatolica TaxID=2670374 RepID=A0A2W2BFE8_9ACTN|nr:ABC transporter substrate-binding protein [Jiangella anatolica]PZF84712.1 peptide ABC transporter substrate-binding protein [Jiangella anatolica]